MRSARWSTPTSTSSSCGPLVVEVVVVPRASGRPRRTTRRPPRRAPARRAGSARRARRWSARSAGRSSKTSTVPSTSSRMPATPVVGWIWADATCSSVVLPAPLGPSTTQRSSSSTVQSTSSSRSRLAAPHGHARELEHGDHGASPYPPAPRSWRRRIVTRRDRPARHRHPALPVSATARLVGDRLAARPRGHRPDVLDAVTATTRRLHVGVGRRAAGRSAGPAPGRRRDRLRAGAPGRGRPAGARRAGASSTARRSTPARPSWPRAPDSALVPRRWARTVVTWRVLPPRPPAAARRRRGRPRRCAHARSRPPRRSPRSTWRGGDPRRRTLLTCGTAPPPAAPPGGARPLCGAGRAGAGRRGDRRPGARRRRRRGLGLGDRRCAGPRSLRSSAPRAGRSWRRARRRPGPRPDGVTPPPRPRARCRWGRRSGTAGRRGTRRAPSTTSPPAARTAATCVEVVGEEQHQRAARRRRGRGVEATDLALAVRGADAGVGRAVVVELPAEGGLVEAPGRREVVTRSSM